MAISAVIELPRTPLVYFSNSANLTAPRTAVMRAWRALRIARMFFPVLREICEVRMSCR
jgi:hypothetical protein